MQLSAGMVVEEADRPSLSFPHAIKRRHPVVTLPGFVTTGLELWRWKPCMRNGVGTTFRQRVFGLHVLSKLMTDPDCVMEHLALDPETAGDPDPHIAVRADSGFDAVDSIMSYWVFAKLQLALSDVGYDPRNFWTASYDWRLSPALMERDNGFFSRFKARVERMVRDSPDGKTRAVVLTHSYGAIVTSETLSAIEADSPGWCGTYIEAVVEIAPVCFFSIGATMSMRERGTAVHGEFPVSVSTRFKLLHDGNVV